VTSGYPWFARRHSASARDGNTRRGDRGFGVDDLEVLVIRPRTALGRDPGDDLVGVLDVAGLAVHAVGGIDLQAFSGAIVDDLVDVGGAEAGARVAVFRGALVDA